MKERPILFSAPMVRAILAGTKTQTRRVVKHKIIGPNPPTGIFDWHHPRTDEWMGAHGGGIKFGLTNAARLCPYGQPGDRLWVREAFAKVDGQTHPWIATDYRATYTHGDRLGDHLGIKRRWTPSIHMPREASRILLEIVSVRVERLQEISEADAESEGAERGDLKDMDGSFKIGGGSHRCGFINLWQSINGPGSWDANPWVWVVEFKRVKP